MSSSLGSSRLPCFPSRPRRRVRHPQSSRHLEGRKQIDRDGPRQRSSLRGPRGRAPANSIAFTMTIDSRMAGGSRARLPSARGNDTIIAVISRNGSIYMVDDDGYTVGTMLAPNRMGSATCGSRRRRRVASCTEMTKQP